MIRLLFITDLTRDTEIGWIQSNDLLSIKNGQLENQWHAYYHHKGGKSESETRILDGKNFKNLIFGKLIHSLYTSSYSCELIIRKCRKHLIFVRELDTVILNCSIIQHKSLIYHVDK